MRPRGILRDREREAAFDQLHGRPAEGGMVFEVVRGEPGQGGQGASVRIAARTRLMRPKGMPGR